MTTNKPVKAISDEAVLVTMRQAGEKLNCSQPKVYEHIFEGNIKAYKVGWRTMIDPQSITTFMFSKPFVPERHPRAKRPPGSPTGGRGRPKKPAMNIVTAGPQSGRPKAVALPGVLPSQKTKVRR